MELIKMKVKKVLDYETLSRSLADVILDYIRSSSEKLICLPSGDTPVGAYRIVSEALPQADIDSLKFKLVGLDEWVGMGYETAGSCQHYLNEHLYKPGLIPKDKIIEFNAQSLNLLDECEKMDDFLQKHGPLDLVVLGIGMNGHLGLNEPGTSFALYSHITDLDEKTKIVAKKYFPHEVKLEKGITLGIKHFLEAKRLILIASGSQKAEIVRRMVEGGITEGVPATMAKLHQNSLLLIDEAAAAKL
jgi:glucosamine-6-phosphate isomerase